MRKSQHNQSRAPQRDVGLARAISKLGFCSRAKAGELIRAGRVTVNGKVRRDAETAVHLGADRIEIDGAAVRSVAKIYLMLNKPRGVVTTREDEQGRATVYDYLRQPGDHALQSRSGAPGSANDWLAPVGRLDKASEGLLLFTNDSEWAARLITPESHIAKTYHVQIATVVNEELLEALRGGVREGKELLRVRHASILRQGERNSWLEIVLDEGRNRHIRRMLNALGIEVLRLIRVAFGPLALGELAKGSARRLTPEEKLALDRAIHPRLGERG